MPLATAPPARFEYEVDAGIRPAHIRQTVAAGGETCALAPRTGPER
jgi:hypothetical protein